MYALTLPRPSPIWIALLLSLFFHCFFLGLLRPTFIEWQGPKFSPLQVGSLSSSDNENLLSLADVISMPPSLFHYSDLLFDTKAAPLSPPPRTLHKKVQLFTEKGDVHFPVPLFFEEDPKVFSQAILLKWQKDAPHPFFFEIKNCPLAFRLQLENWLRGLTIPSNLQTSSPIQEGTLYIESFYSYD